VRVLGFGERVGFWVGCGGVVPGWSVASGLLLKDAAVSLHIMLLLCCSIEDYERTLQV
jgi:hypothetical protein